MPRARRTRAKREWLAIACYAAFDDDLEMFFLALWNYYNPPPPKARTPLVHSTEWWKLGFPDLYYRDDPTQFIKRFRITPELFATVAAPMWRTWNFRGYNPDVRLATVLTMLAHPGNYRAHAMVTGVGASTCVGWLRLVCNSIIANFRHIIRLPLPGTREEADLLAQFNATPFWGCKAIIDSSHIRLHSKPAGAWNADDYRYRKKCWTVHLQALCDSTGRFLDVCIGQPGATHDAALFGISPIYANAHRYFQNTFILADKAYPMLPWCLPMIKNAVTPAQLDFNEAAAPIRVAIEQAFGRLKQRWRMLMDLDFDLSYASDAIWACCILETLCHDARVEIIEDEDDPDMPDDPDHLPDRDDDDDDNQPSPQDPIDEDGAALRQRVLQRFQPLAPPIMPLRPPPAPQPAPQPAVPIAIPQPVANPPLQLPPGIDGPFDPLAPRRFAGLHRAHVAEMREAMDDRYVDDAEAEEDLLYEDPEDDIEDENSSEASEASEDPSSSESHMEVDEEIEDNAIPADSPPPEPEEEPEVEEPRPAPRQSRRARVNYGQYNRVR